MAIPKHTSALEDWQQAQLRALSTRFAPLLALPDGTLHDVVSPLHHIRIVKQGDQIHFYFINTDGTLDGPMSRIDLRRPLHLIAGYTQAALLALLWSPTPQHACLLGLAGGRMSLVLYHTFRDLIIDNVEIDPLVGPIATLFFGLTFDTRQQLFVADARAFLRAASAQYDIIVMDAFRDATDNLDQLATSGFYANAKKQLAPHGVLVANLLASDQLFAAKVATFDACFAQAYAVVLKHSAVLFGVPARLSAATIVQRAATLQQRHGFDFPIAERAATLQPLRASGLLARGDRGTTPLLTDFDQSDGLA